MLIDTVFNCGFNVKKRDTNLAFELSILASYFVAERVASRMKALYVLVTPSLSFLGMVRKVWVLFKVNPPFSKRWDNS